MSHPHFTRRIAEVRNRTLMERCTGMARRARRITPASVWFAAADRLYALYISTDDSDPSRVCVGFVDMESPLEVVADGWTVVHFSEEGQPHPLYGALFEGIDTTRPSGDAFRAMIESNFDQKAVATWQRTLREISDLPIAA